MKTESRGGTPPRNTLMYAYKIGYYSHEESPYVVLLHKQQFSEMELTELVAEAIDMVLQQWAGAPVSLDTNEEDYEFSTTSRVTRIGDIYAPAAAWLVKHRGFQPQNFVATCFFPGWAGIHPDVTESWMDYDQHPLNVSVRERITPLVSRINEKNESIDRFINEWDETDDNSQ